MPLPKPSQKRLLTQKRADEPQNRAIVFVEASKSTPMRDNNDRPSAPNFTQACIVMFGVNVFWVFTVIWVVWGLMAVALLGWALNALINQIAARQD